MTLSKQSICIFAIYNFILTLIHIGNDNSKSIRTREFKIIGVEKSRAKLTIKEQ